MAFDPILKVFKKNYQVPNRSNWQLDNKSRLSMDIGYLYPVAVYDVLPNTYFKLDMNAVLSSNPTISPILGSLKFRAEAFFVEKAAYCSRLRNNERLPVDRNIPFPTFDSFGNATNGNSSFKPSYLFSPATGLLEHLQMYPTGWSESDWALRSFDSVNNYPDTFEFPKLNAIPFIMYHDIYRNYYINVQDQDNIPIRSRGFAPVGDDEFTFIRDIYVTRQQFDDFVEQSRDSDDVNVVYEEIFELSPFGFYTPSDTLHPQARSDQNHQSYLHHCLLRRTYNNDFFTSFISNDNVELMKNYSTIDTSGGSITVEQISLANRNWRFATRSLLWGTDWSDYNRVHFGTKVITRYGKPQFLGSISSDVIFNDVISHSQTGNNGTDTDSYVDELISNKNLGSRAGMAFGNLTNYTSDKDKYKPFVEFTTEEEGYVMVLLSLVPEVNYYQGVDPMFFKTNLQHSYSPEYNAYGMQDFMKSWASALPHNIANVTYGRSFEEFNTAIHQVPIWYEYMARYNQLHGLFTLDNVYKYWTFVRAFTELGNYFEGLVDSTDQQSADFYGFYKSTYVLPEMHNYQFANNVGVDNFQVQIKFDCFAKQLLDKQIIAYL